MRCQYSSLAFTHLEVVCYDCRGTDRKSVCVCHLDGCVLVHHNEHALYLLIRSDMKCISYTKHKEQWCTRVTTLSIHHAKRGGCVVHLRMELRSCPVQTPHRHVCFLFSVNAHAHIHILPQTWCVRMILGSCSQQCTMGLSAQHPLSGSECTRIHSVDTLLSVLSSLIHASRVHCVDCAKVSSICNTHTHTRTCTCHTDVSPCTALDKLNARILYDLFRYQWTCSSASVIAQRSFSPLFFLIFRERGNRDLFTFGTVKSR